MIQKNSLPAHWLIPHLSDILSIFLFFIIILYNSVNITAQNESNIWYFGEHAGIDFNSGTPVALLDGAMNISEGCATICDEKGDLLFYTNGLDIWNRSHSIMNNGTDLLGHESSTQSAVVVKKPSYDNIYVVFTVDFEGQSGGFSYSEIDMELDGGLGGVTAVKNQHIVANVCEKIAVVQHENEEDFWIIIHLFNSSQFYSYLLTAAGLNQTPVVSSIGPTVSGSTLRTIGYLKSSIDGRYIAAGHHGAGIVSLCKFNSASGQLFDEITLDSRLPYGLEFSPSGDILYVGEYYPQRIVQYDLSVWSRQTISNSEIELESGGAEPGAFQLGPDFKIYIARLNQGFLSVINDPDELGSNCNYVSQGFSLNGRGSKLGLPTFNSALFVRALFDSEYHCFGDSTYFSLLTRTVDSVLWNFGDPASGVLNTSTEQSPRHVFSSSGTFKVSLITYLKSATDTSVQDIVIHDKPNVNLGADTTLCQPMSYLLNVSAPSHTYLWQDGSVDSQFSASTTGLFYVEVTNEHMCTDQDSVSLVFQSPPEVFLGNDTTICQGDTVELNSIQPNVTYRWSNGAQDASIYVSNEGNYSLTVTDDVGCINSDSINVKINVPPAISLGNDVTVCDTDTFYLSANVSATNYKWSTGELTSGITVNTTDQYQVSVTDNFGCTSSDQINISFSKLKHFDLGNDTTLCDGDSISLNTMNVGQTYLWSTGDTTQFIDVAASDLYQVEVRDTFLCLMADDISITTMNTPDIQLPADTYICIGDNLVVDVSAVQANYLWQDASTQSYYDIRDAGVYFVNVDNACGTASDTILIEMENCDCRVYVPNVFSPNQDAINDIFNPLSDCTFISFHLQVFNRWGGLVFESDNADIGWNGMLGNKTQLEGVYAYILNYQFEQQDPTLQSGSLSLIR